MYELPSTRRDFLKTTGGLIVTFTLADSVVPAVAQEATPTKTVALDEVDAYLSIGSEGQVTLYTGKVDLGTGLRTALTQIRVKKGTISADGKGLSYAELMSGRTFSLKLDKEAPVKEPTMYTIVGKSVPGVDIPAKITARFEYMHDFRVAGMLHGRVIRPLAIGANLDSVDEFSVTSIPGFVKVVREGNFLGVIAKTEWGAIQAAQKLKSTWSNWAGLPERAQLWDYVRAPSQDWRYGLRHCHRRRTDAGKIPRPFVLPLRGRRRGGLGRRSTGEGTEREGSEGQAAGDEVVRNS
jgi:hypothetical protein